MRAEGHMYWKNLLCGHNICYRKRTSSESNEQAVGGKVELLFSKLLMVIPFIMHKACLRTHSRKRILAL